MNTQQLYMAQLSPTEPLGTVTARGIVNPACSAYASRPQLGISLGIDIQICIKVKRGIHIINFYIRKARVPRGGRIIFSSSDSIQSGRLLHPPLAAPIQPTDASVIWHANTSSRFIGQKHGSDRRNSKVLRLHRRRWWHGRLCGCRSVG